MTRVLLIDDEQDSLTPLLDELADRESFECKCCDFGSAKDLLGSYRPGAVVLDLLRQSSTKEPELVGNEAFEYVFV
jgi:DNA-binding response OmpR family regulator